MRTKPLLGLAEEIRLGLSDPVQRTLPAAALYDDVGTALFEAITVLPEYGLTRADLRLLKRHAGNVAGISRAARIVELGSGSGTKTRALLDAFPGDVSYSPVDVSRAALDRCVAELSAYNVEPVQDEFLPGLAAAAANRDGTPMLVLFLGSNIGNFAREDVPSFFAAVRRLLRPGDTFLVGADLVKPVDVLIAAYDDAAGVTAAFNRNVLARINREFDADFRVRCFEHEARWNDAERRIEMHLRVASRQVVHVRSLGLTLGMEAGDSIWTESSHKFDVEELRVWAAGAGFQTEGCWVDQEWPFAELLLRAN